MIFLDIIWNLLNFILVEIGYGNFDWNGFKYYLNLRVCF